MSSSASATMPPKLLKRILDLEYIDMVELIPDFWRFQDDYEGASVATRLKGHEEAQLPFGRLLRDSGISPCGETPRESRRILSLPENHC